MGITAKNVRVNTLENNNVPTSPDENKLSKEELELLINLIKKSSFLGEHIEIIYNLVLKLQNQFLEETR
jgi:hypothetical protein